MRGLFGLVMGLGLASGAHAQAPASPVMGPPPGLLDMAPPPAPPSVLPGHAPSGNAQLDQAIALCDDHQGFPVLSKQGHGAMQTTWVAGWTACGTIVGLWGSGSGLDVTQQAQVGQFLLTHATSAGAVQ